MPNVRAVYCPTSHESCEPLTACDGCGGPFCQDCFCLLKCDQVTSEDAFEAGVRALGILIPKPSQTICIEDEYGAVFSVTGPTEWLLQVPEYEDTEGLELHLPAEFSKVHELKQQQAVSTGQAGYLTPSFGVAIKRFEIRGRAFTVSVFDLA